MNDAQLEQLLHQAAEVDPTPSMPDDLAARVRRRWALRRRRRRAAGGVAGVVVLLAATSVWCLAGGTSRPTRAAGGDTGPPLRTHASDPGMETPDLGAGTGAADSGAATTTAINDEIDVAALQAEIARLKEQVAQLEAKIEDNVARHQLERRVAALRRKWRKPDPRDLVAAENAKTAFLLTHRAEACERRNRPDEARQEYEQVVSLFPGTSWAKTAQERLDQGFANTREQ